MNNLRSIFFSILRSSLGTDVDDSPIMLSKRQWKKLFHISCWQMLVTISFKEIVRRPNNMPLEIKIAWEDISDYNSAKFDAHLMALTRLSQLLSDNGISLMVLKGLGLSLLYPDPQTRECSDVDVYCYGEYEKVNELLLQKGEISRIIEENDKHCSFMFDGINIENHRYFCEYVNNANIVLGQEIMSLSKEQSMTDERISSVYFPSPQMGIHHLMMHTLSHLAWSGITVRHLVDCGLYMSHYRSEIDWDKATELWKKAGIFDAAVVISSLCREYLGLDMPTFGTCSSGHCSFVLNSIFNPLKSSSRVKNPLRKLFRKSIQYRRRSILHPLVYGEAFPDSFSKSFAFLRHGQKQH